MIIPIRPTILLISAGTPKIKKLIITDTIDNSKKIKKTNKIQVLSIAQLMAEAIKRISNSTSVSSLFN